MNGAKAAGFFGVPIGAFSGVTVAGLQYGSPGWVVAGALAVLGLVLYFIRVLGRYGSGDRMTWIGLLVAGFSTFFIVLWLSPQLVNST
ncbi:MAG TPA: hypothetical protein VD907_02335 [Verrucomicrobiae bacterium]|nr:hypothetical protein [Verrucomicrobiae bacterium]